MHILAANINYS